MIDSAGGHAGTWCAVEGNVRHCVTVSLNVSYAGQARGGMLIADSHVRGGGRSIYFASTEIRDERGTLLAFGAIGRAACRGRVWRYVWIRVGADGLKKKKT